jgi:hypothetical protein
MASKREIQLKQLIYTRNELIKECKKDLKNYRKELNEIQKRKEYIKCK